MAHQLESFVSTKQEWHHHLTRHAIVEKPMTVDDLVNTHGLGWEVEKRPLYYAKSDGTAIKCDQRFAIVRKTDEKALGTCGPKYKCFQNRALFDALALLAEDTGEFRFQTAGSLYGGKRVFALGQFTKRYEVLEGDFHDTFLFGSLDHAAEGSVSFFGTDVRVVCANTEAMALRQADNNKIVRMTHTGDLDMKLEQARAIIGLAHQMIQNNAEGMRQLQQIVMSERAAQRFLAGLFPMPAVNEDMAPMEKEKLLESRDRVIEVQLKVHELAMDTGRGIKDFPQVRGTAYGWLNAVTEYATHEMNRRDTTVGGQLVAMSTGEGGKLTRDARRLLASKDLVTA
jgi:phage/plasmid-like protein (TIGR03299 family)